MCNLKVFARNPQGIITTLHFPLALQSRFYSHFKVCQLILLVLACNFTVLVHSRHSVRSKNPLHTTWSAGNSRQIQWETSWWNSGACSGKTELKGQWLLELHSSDGQKYNSKWMVKLRCACWMSKEATFCLHVWQLYKVVMCQCCVCSLLCCPQVALLSTFFSRCDLKLIQYTFSFFLLVTLICLFTPVSNVFYWLT